MDTLQTFYKKYTDFDVRLHTVTEELPHRLLSGRAILNPEENDFTFVENPPRGQRSVQVARGAHSRTVRRPDGWYTTTLRYTVEEKYVGSALLSEVREAVIVASEDRRLQAARMKERETEERKNDNTK